MTGGKPGMLPIDHGVPLPTEPPGRPKGIPNRRPWRSMEVGDSFLVPDAEVRVESASAAMASRRLGRRFVVRPWWGGVRVWRVE